MAITVVGNQTVAGLSFVKIRAGVAVVDPVTSVTYIAPVAGVSYIELAVSAQIDTSGLFQFVPDTAVMTDGTSFSLAKLLAESVPVPDATRFEFEKAVVGDSVTLADVFTKLLTYNRILADTFGLTDAQVLAVGKPLQDSVPVYDATASQVSKALADTFVLNDTTARQFVKALSDVTGLADGTQFILNMAVSDTAGTTDALAYAFSKALADTFALQDDDFFALTKLLADGVAMNDSFDAGDGAVFSFSKGVSNVTMVGDATAKHPVKVLADDATAEDAGSLVSQSYCDLTYFAEDYVGESRVF